MQWFKRSFLQIDPRTLGLVRIALSLLLLFDLAKRASEIDVWYGNDGLLPNHTGLWRPVRSWHFSLLWTCSRWEEAAVFFVFFGLCYLGLLVGYRTRLMQLLSLIAIISLQVRVDLLSNGGDFVLCIFMWWTLFMPLGQRFSVDAIRKTLRSKQEQTAGELDFAARPKPVEIPFVSLAVLAASFQFALIYVFNALHKSGDTWLQGQAVYYVIRQAHLATEFGAWAQSALPLSVTRVLTYGTLAIEGALPFLLLTPWGRPWARRLAIVLVFALHLGIQLFANFGVFSLIMCVYALLFVSREDWELLRRRAEQRLPLLLVYYDDDCGVCFQCARLLARLDLYQRLVILPNSSAKELPPGLDRERFERTIIVVQTDQTGKPTKFWERSQALGRIVGSLPLGRSVAWLFFVGQRLINIPYQRFADHRAEISSFLGFGVCGARPTRVSNEEPAQTPMRQQLRRYLFLVRESAVAFLVLVATSQLLVENPMLAQHFRLAPNEWLRATVSYTRLQQGWRMFSPDAPKNQTYLVVDAKTQAGRHVDPINDIAAQRSDPGLREVPSRAGHNVYWTNYTTRMVNNRTYHRPLQQWLEHYHVRTGNPDDKIVSFEAYALQKLTPAPGAPAAASPAPRIFLRKP